MNMAGQNVFRYALHTLVLCCLWSQANTASISLPSYPLAVKSPYLSAWLPGNQSSHVPTAQPQFWTGTTNLTWTVLARVNGTTYTLFGAPGGILNSTAATQTSSVVFTSSHTSFHLTAANVQFTLDFFSPVLPKAGDYARQSLPYSYLTVSAKPPADAVASIEILSAIDQSWTAQNGAAGVNYTDTGSSSLFWFYNPRAYHFTEQNDMATYGSVIFATSHTAATLYGCSDASTIYADFTAGGTLPGALGGKCNNNDLVALANNLGNVKGSSSTTFTIGFDRVYTISYLNSTTYTGYYRSQWPTIPAAVDYVLQNYATLNGISQTFDQTMRRRATAVSSSFGSAYADIIEASVRQAFAALEITIPLSTLSTAAPYAFLKEISSDGNVNTIDVIYPTFPIFISLNPEYIKLLLRPVLDYLNRPFSIGWPNNYVIHDIGYHYPNATGHNNGVQENMPLYETSALFHLLAAYQRYSGDTSFIQPYLPRLQLYADYLANNSLYPASQLTSVDAISATANRTSLAIQSVIGLKAAAVLLNQDTYSTTASTFADQIYTKGLGLNSGSTSTSTHFTFKYEQPNGWITVYQAYIDILLELNTFPSAAWEMQTNWYLKQNLPAGLPYFGPFKYSKNFTGGGCDWSITDWSFWASAASTSTTLQEGVITATHAFLTNGQNTEPFGTKYTVRGPGGSGLWIGNRARSTVGANFALLALKQGTWTAY